MLRIDFINVGDGDAILLRHEESGLLHTVLVDCGRPFVEFTPGSQRNSCIDYLLRAGVEKIDLMLVSHLHLDHIGGAMAVLHHIPVARMVALSFPPESACWICPPLRAHKPVVGLCDVLNLFQDVVSFAKSRGTQCEEARAGNISLGNLTLDVYLPDAELAARQSALFRMLYSGGMPPDEEIETISKERNASSLLLRVEYAGRSVLLTGDSYASCWQDRGVPSCDILKLPHHGDGKSMTESLLRSLSPAVAVISCQNDPVQKKDRPNLEVLSLLLQEVPQVFCTENRAFPFYPAATRDAVRVVVQADGSIVCP